ncbi:AAA family ATPase [Kribbella sp. NBC_01245]|uniref:ATP-binding protein n=1 Tax=Kribbella sp. NBC_01245 TaxID=2903578 RepID=UPI002E2BD22C|nr:AAA family ATPase [Kribbella sp. NBC_01245]
MSSLVEREGELATIAARLAAVAQGQGQLLWLEGAAGIGKSALLDAAVAAAHESGFSVLSARGGEWEREFGHGVVRQLFERLVAGRDELFAGSAALAGPMFGVGGPASGDEQSILHGLYWLTSNLAASGPLAIVVDDVHWVDPASLRFLLYVARRLHGMPILLALANRTGEAATDTEVLAAIRDQSGTRIAPAPLTVRGVQGLIEVTETDDEFVKACHEVTGGNPFLVRELSVVIAERGLAAHPAGAEQVRQLGPQSVSAAVLRRLELLGSGPRRLAQSVAVLGQDAALRHAAELAGISPADAALGADALVRIQVFRPGVPLDFVHPIVRRAVYEGMPSGARALAHRAAAAMLLREGLGAGSVATHLMASEPAGDQVVVETLREAARQTSVGAPDAAAAYLRRALAEPPQHRVAVLRELGRAEVSSGQPEGVIHLKEALRVTEEPAERVGIARELALGLVLPGRYAEAIDALETALDHVTDADLALQLSAEIVTVSRLVPDARETTDRHLRALQGPLPGDSPGERVALASLAMQTLVDGGPAGRVAELATRAVRGGLIAEQTSDYHVVYDALGALWPTESVNATAEALGEAVADARRRGSVLAFARASSFRAQFRFSLGDLDEAESDALLALDAAAERRWPIGFIALSALLDVLVERGRYDDAETQLELWGGHDDIPHTFMMDFLLAARGRLRLAQRRTQEAVDDLLELGRRESVWPGRCPAVFAYRSQAALGLLALGDRDEARRLAAEEVPLARRWGTRSAIGISLRAAGLTAGGDLGLDLLADAERTLADSPARLEHARSAVELGSALRRAGRRTDARLWLAKGLDQASLLGATALAARARDELVAAGARPQRDRTHGLPALTPSELRVARMAASGLKNPEIAQALFVTLRNVELHLTHTYQKLGISSRDELRASLASLSGQSLRSAP